MEPKGMTLAEHKKTPGYIKAKESLLDKLAQWGGIQRKLFDPVDLPKRRAELQRQAAELAKRRAEPEAPDIITDDDIPF